MPSRNYDDEELDDAEFPETGEDDRDETIPCPYCRRPVYEEAERCPHCANWLSREDAPGRPAPWLVVGVMACLAVVLLWILAR